MIAQGIHLFLSWDSIKYQWKQGRRTPATGTQVSWGRDYHCGDGFIIYPTGRTEHSCSVAYLYGETETEEQSLKYYASNNYCGTLNSL
jgi:hypothetical protein